MTDWNASSPSLNIDSLNSLSDLATSIFNDASSSTDLMASDDTEPGSRPMMLLAESLFHQCQIILHSMLVPFFSGAPTGPGVGAEMVKRSAEIVVRHAGLHNKLLAPFLYRSCDVTQLPPLIGYGAFITGIVLLVTGVSCQDKTPHATTAERRVESRQLRAVREILRLLNVLRRHWNTLGLLVSSDYLMGNPTHTYICETQSEQLDSALQRQLLASRSQEELTAERNIVSGVEPIQTGNETTHPGDSVQGSPADLRRVRLFEKANRSMYGANDFQPASSRDVLEACADSRNPLALPENCSRIGETNSIDFDPLLIEQPGVSLDDAWYNLPFGDEGLEQYAGFEPVALFQQGWRVFN